MFDVYWTRWSIRPESCVRRLQAVISVDTKKRELVGDFKNNVQEWTLPNAPDDRPAAAGSARMVRTAVRFIRETTGGAATRKKGA